MSEVFGEKIAHDGGKESFFNAYSHMSDREWLRDHHGNCSREARWHARQRCARLWALLILDFLHARVAR